jgi:hypothetical protein
MKGPRHSLFWLILAAGATFFSARGKADNFAKVRYDRQTDRLLVTLVYGGTNSNHHFTLKWGECQANQSGTLPGVTAEVLDDQYDDVAEQEFTKTVGFKLTGMPCQRPARVTVRTAPRFFYTLTIPK